MRSILCASGFAVVALALRMPVERQSCTEIQIPISVSVPRFIINATIEDDWDAAALTFNLTRRDSATAAVLVSGSTSSPVNSTYTVGATLCGTGETILVLTHGIIESKLYWRPNLKGASQYSFVDAAVAAGYSVLSYDRIGVGSSSKVSSFSDAQFQVETAVLNSIVGYARDTVKATKVALVGHSYGSYITAQSASEVDVDAVVLTGFNTNFAYFGSFLSGAGFRVAKTQDPERWGTLDSGYLTSSDLYADTYIFFAEPYFEHRIAEWAHSVVSEPFAVGELLSLLQTTLHIEQVAAPVLLLQGQFDLASCGGNCIGLLDETAAQFTAAKSVKVIDNLPAGHSPNLHKVAPQAFQLVFDFLKEQGL